MERARAATSTEAHRTQVCVHVCACVCVCICVFGFVCQDAGVCPHVFCCVFVYVCSCVREREGLGERQKARENKRERAATSTEAHRTQVCLSLHFFFLCPCVFVCMCVRVREGLRGGVCVCVLCVHVVCVCVLCWSARVQLRLRRLTGRRCMCAYV